MYGNTKKRRITVIKTPLISIENYPFVKPFYLLDNTIFFLLYQDISQTITEILYIMLCVLIDRLSAL